MQNGIMRNAVMLSVVAPPDYLRLLSASVIKLFYLFLPIKLDRLSSNSNHSLMFVGKVIDQLIVTHTKPRSQMLD